MKKNRKAAWSVHVIGSRKSGFEISVINEKEWIKQRMAWSHPTPKKPWILKEHDSCGWFGLHKIAIGDAETEISKAEFDALLSLAKNVAEGLNRMQL